MQNIGAAASHVGFDRNLGQTVDCDMFLENVDAMVPSPFHPGLSNRKLPYTVSKVGHGQ